MKHVLALSILFLSAVANARQTATDLSHSELAIVGSDIVLTGAANGRRYSQKIARAQVKGLVGGIDCQVADCSGPFRSMRNGDVRLSVQVDSDQDGNIDATEELSVGRFNADGSITMTVKARYLLIEETYSIFEKLADARNSAYLAVVIEN